MGLGPDDIITPTSRLDHLRGINIVQVSSGHSNTVFLDSIGNVYTSGALSSRIHPTRITQFIEDGRRIRKPPKIVQVSMVIVIQYY